MAATTAVPESIVEEVKPENNNNDNNNNNNNNNKNNMTAASASTSAPPITEDALLVHHDGSHSQSQVNGSVSTTSSGPNQIGILDANSEICAAWTQIELDRKKITLQQERLNLDRQLMEASRQKLLRETSLSATNNTNESPPEEGLVKELQDQVEDLEDQIKGLEEEVVELREELQKERAAKVTEARQYFEMLNDLNTKLEESHVQQAQLEDEMLELQSMHKEELDRVQRQLQKEVDALKQSHESVKDIQSIMSTDTESETDIVEVYQVGKNTNASSTAQQQQQQEEGVKRQYEQKIKMLEGSHAAILKGLKDNMEALRSQCRDTESDLKLKKLQFDRERQDMQEQLQEQAAETRKLKKQLDVEKMTSETPLSLTLSSFDTKEEKRLAEKNVELQDTIKSLQDRVLEEQLLSCLLGILPWILTSVAASVGWFALSFHLTLSLSLCLSFTLAVVSFASYTGIYRRGGRTKRKTEPMPTRVRRSSKEEKNAATIAEIPEETEQSAKRKVAFK